ncbi:hypothetical protein CROQUDRAFT_92354 [Cronartium quercuum f. sp. fusiforme G11]|uniref:HMG box domain-containing protein n=1 Tax=Cronartium quercuum f. sp. fusiforme G11 TaxID=708437 RepID=A0A9P6TDF9_9BASI|nr:hypothetical protein CROQUDRAFT_92354 [Cronartium quercuum f. sp. fusiforme G11]
MRPTNNPLPWSQRQTSGPLSQRNPRYPNTFQDSSSSRISPATVSNFQHRPILPEPRLIRSLSRPHAFGNRQSTEASFSTSPFPSQETNSTFVAGQFSDAESDEDPTPTESKRQRTDRPTGDQFVGQKRDTSDVQMTGVGLQALSPSTSRHTNLSQSTTRLSIPARELSIGCPNVVEPTTGQNTVQLPFAVRRLATLVGIPESSQAIIQSTLPLPLNRTSSQGLSTVNDQRPSTGLHQRSLSASVPPRSASVLPEHYLRAPSSFETEVVPTENLSDGQLGSTARSSKDSGALIDERLEKSAKRADLYPRIDTSLSTLTRADHLKNTPSYVPTSTSTSGISSNTAHLSPALFDQLCHALGPSAPPSRAIPDIDPIFAAPKFTQSASEPGGFTMPARGTFSIPAPSSMEEFQALEMDSPANFELPESSHSLGEGPSGNGHPTNSNGVPTDNGPVELTPSEAPTQSTRKRKARTSKKKAEASNPAADDGDPQVELVKPPPTINGKISHGRKVPAGYVKRTPNSFIMFRSHVIANKLLPPGVEKDNRQISRVVSGLWAGLSEDDMRTWQEASSELRAAARAKNPDLKNPPNHKRKAIVRRKRTGQLPGETPEQRVEREKARAAALAKVIIDARGERLDKDKLVELAGISELEKSIIDASPRPRDPSREASRPEFRAPATTGSIAISEGAESTLTTSPRPNPRGLISPVLESVTEGHVSNSNTSRAKVATKKPARVRRPAVNKQLSDGSKPPPKSRSLKQASKVCVVSEETSQTCAPGPTDEPIAESLPVTSTSAEGSNMIDLSVFSSLFESLPNQMESSTFPDCYSQDVFQAFGNNPLQQNDRPSTSDPSSSKAIANIPIDPSILSMASMSMQVGTSESNNDFWGNTVLPHQSNESDSNVMDGIGSLDLLSQLPNSNQSDLENFIGQYNGVVQHEEEVGNTEFSFDSIYLNHNLPIPSTSTTFPDSESTEIEKTNERMLVGSQSFVEELQNSSTQSTSHLENWTWPQL